MGGGTSITREFYLGCGAGAGSYTGNRIIYHFSIYAYIQIVGHGNMPIARETRLTPVKSAAYYFFPDIHRKDRRSALQCTVSQAMAPETDPDGPALERSPGITWATTDAHPERL